MATRRNASKARASSQEAPAADGTWEAWKKLNPNARRLSDEEIAQLASERLESEQPAIARTLDWSPAPDALLSECANVFLDASAGAADRDDAARQMLRDFCMRHVLGKPPSGVTLRWLANVASAALDHSENAYRNFGLAPRSKHRSKGSGQDWTPRVAVLELLRRVDSTKNALAVVGEAIGAKDTRRLEKAAAALDLNGLDGDHLRALAGDRLLRECVKVIRRNRKAYPKLSKWADPPAQK